jgi:hypothetical protein
MKKQVLVIAEAASGIELGIDLHDAIEDGVGPYFRDPIIAEIRRLGVYFGEHRIHLGDFRALSSRFPCAIYYQDREGTRQVIAVLNLRCSPEWIRDQLSAGQ